MKIKVILVAAVLLAGLVPGLAQNKNADGTSQVPWNPKTDKYTETFHVYSASAGCWMTLTNGSTGYTVHTEAFFLRHI